MDSRSLHTGPTLADTPSAAMLLVLLMRVRVVAHVTELASEGDSLILQVSFIVIVVQSPSRVRLSATQWTVASSELAATA